jgi:transposase
MDTIAMPDAEDANIGSGRRRRRLWSEESKRQILAECLGPGVSAAEVARRHGINANLLFTWRRQLGAKNLSGAGEPVTIVPITVMPERQAPVAPVSLDFVGRMEIVLAAGERIIVGADVDAAALGRVVKALLRR